jgi:hypothetical protein
MPRNRLPRVMKHYFPTSRRNYGRPLKRLLDTWDRNGSTSGPTPWQIYDDDDHHHHLIYGLFNHALGTSDTSASNADYRNPSYNADLCNADSIASVKINVKNNLPDVVIHAFIVASCISMIQLFSHTNLCTCIYIIKSLKHFIHLIAPTCFDT